MTRVAATMLGLAAFIAVGLGARAYWGGKAYLAGLLGSDALADDMLARALAEPEAQVLGMSPWTLLVAFAVLASAALVLLVLWPWDLLLRRMGLPRGRRALAGAAMGAAAAGLVLWSVHPLLSLPSVPEGPRTVLNYACEAAGYGWVNAIAYVGAIAAGGALAWLGGEAGTRARSHASTAAVDTIEAAEPGPSDAAAPASDPA